MILWFYSKLQKFSGYPRIVVDFSRGTEHKSCVQAVLVAHWDLLVEAHNNFMGQKSQKISNIKGPKKIFCTVGNFAFTEIRTRNIESQLGTHFFLSEKWLIFPTVVWPPKDLFGFFLKSATLKRDSSNAFIIKTNFFNLNSWSKFLTFEALKTAFLHFLLLFKNIYFSKKRRVKKGSDFLYQRAKKSWGNEKEFLLDLEILVILKPLGRVTYREVEKGDSHTLFQTFMLLSKIGQKSWFWPENPIACSNLMENYKNAF